MNVATPFEQLDLQLVPGPLTLVEPAISFDTHEIVQYSPDRVAQTILSFPGVHLLKPASPSWWDWKARCEADEGYIEVCMTLFDTEPAVWGGSDLKINCSPKFLFDFWTHVRSVCPAGWLHDTECRLYSPESFSKHYLYNASVTAMGISSPDKKI